MRQYLITAAMLLLLLFGVADLAAQPPPPTLPNMPDQAPIDGGLGLLALSGGAYAWKRLKGEKQA